MQVEITQVGVDSRDAAWRSTLIALIGPLTVLAGVVWGVAHPYRLTLLEGLRAGVWDQIAQPPLLVVAVGLVFEFAVARPLLRELRGHR